ncbi:hypothetical protein HDV00_006713 [Rhizophlyctis rosea]|nr:hypothetical protein HDV00_006713 [Rhizophlyctis rosea]
MDVANLTIYITIPDVKPQVLPCMFFLDIVLAVSGQSLTQTLYTCLVYHITLQDPGYNKQRDDVFAAGVGVQKREQSFRGQRRRRGPLRAGTQERFVLAVDVVGNASAPDENELNFMQIVGDVADDEGKEVERGSVYKLVVGMNDLKETIREAAKSRWLQCDCVVPRNERKEMGGGCARFERFEVDVERAAGEGGYDDLDIWIDGGSGFNGVRIWRSAKATLRAGSVSYINTVFGTTRRSQVDISKCFMQQKD